MCKFLNYSTAKPREMGTVEKTEGQEKYGKEKLNSMTKTPPLS